MINILTADILSLNIPGVLDVLTDFAGETPIPLFMLVGAILNELVIVMIILSRVLKYGVNRWVNIIVGLFTIAYIWGGATPYHHYISIATVETPCLLLVIWSAWKGSEHGA
jgi:predicted membrane-bound dolichyl-phosphate-mannose-protein mannosyltransferase